MKRNITIELDETTLQNAKTVAARRSVSVSHLLRDQLAALAKQDNSYEVAKQNAIANFAKPLDITGEGYKFDRESIYDR